VSVDLYSYGVQERPVAETEELYQSWGISPGKTIVIYDQGGSMMATWLFFGLEYHGFPTTDVLILDGGLAKWQEAGLPVTKAAAPVPNKGSFKIRNLAAAVKAELPEFLTATGDTVSNALVEALGGDRHFGELFYFDRAGHIPNAILLPSVDFYNPDKTQVSRRAAAHADLSRHPSSRSSHRGAGWQWFYFASSSCWTTRVAFSERDGLAEDKEGSLLDL
jgi:3-mercaptopyruvate sulfurtransferase SseA